MANIGIGPLGAMQYVQQQGELGRQRGREQFTQRTAGEIINGDPAAYGKLAAVDPAAAKQAQSDGDAQLRRMGGLIKFFEEADARDPNEAQALWVSQGVPYVRQFANGTEPTQNWQEAKPMIQQLKAKIAAAEAASRDPKDQPTGFREAHLKAVAAGYQPGTPEYQRAMKISLGTEAGLARTQPKTITTDINGVPTTLTFDPGTQSYRVAVIDGGPAPVPMPGPAPGTNVVASPGGTVDAGNGPQAVAPGAVGVDAVLAAENQARVSEGLPPMTPEREAQFRAAYAEANGASNAGGVTAPSAPQTAQAAPQAPGVPIVGRTKEAEAAAVTAAQEGAKLPYLSEAERIKAEAARAQAAGIASDKVDIEVGAKQAQKERDAVNTLDLLDDIEALLPKSTSGGAESLVSNIAAYFGHTTEGRAKIAAIAPMAAKLVGYVPRFEGPQSDKDVQLYRDAAGDLANPDKPVGERLAALYQLRSLAMKYAGSMGGSGGQAAPAQQAPAPAGVDHSNLWN